MSYYTFFTEGFCGNFRSSEPTNTIAQFTVVCLDKTTPYGVVRPDNANAGRPLGINVSTGVDPQGNSTPQTPIYPGNPLRVFIGKGFCKVQVMTGVAVNIGDTLYITSAGQGLVTNQSGSGAQPVGVALSASSGNPGETVDCYLTI